MKNTKIGETCLAVSRIESEFLSKLIETVKSQSEMIARLTAERAELKRRKPTDGGKKFSAYRPADSPYSTCPL